MGQGVEEAGRWELFCITHHNSLLTTEDGAKRINWPYLACLVENDHVETDATRRQIRSHRQRTHHEDRLDSLNSIACACHELAYGHVPGLLRNFTSQYTELTACLMSRELVPVSISKAGPVMYYREAVKFTELLD